MTKKRPVTANDLLRFRPLSDPQMAPDGSKVAYVLTTHDLENDRSTSAIWVAPTDGVALSPFTNPPEACRDWSPRWSPDGRTLAFLSNRSKKPQIWLIDADGGEARCIETKEAVSSAPVWSPDGTLIAFTAPVFAYPDDWQPYPGAPAGDRARIETAANADPGAPKQGKGAPSDIRVITHMHFRFDGIGFGGEKHSQLFVVPADGGEARQVTNETRHITDPSWSPDGKALYCVAARDNAPSPFIYSPRDLVKVDLASSEVSCFHRSEFPVLSPVSSPDGRYVACIGFADAANMGDGSSDVLVWRSDAPQEPPVNLTAELDRSASPLILASDVGGMAVRMLQWTADSKALYCRISDRGAAPLYALPVNGDAPRILAGGDEQYVFDYHLGAGGDLALITGTAVTPGELVVRTARGERTMTDHNGFHRELDLQPTEPFTFTGADGWSVSGWIMKPAGYVPGRRYPAYLDVHGGPQGAWGNALHVAHQGMAAAGIAVISINPRGSQGYGRLFTRAVTGDFGGKDYEDLMLGVDAVVAMGIADPDRLAIGGWSYGGYMSSWTVTQTDRFKAAFVGAPVTNLHSMNGTSDVPVWTIAVQGSDPYTAEGVEKMLSRSAVRFANRVTTPCLIACGEADMRTPVSQADEFYMALRHCGKAPAFQVRYPGSFHGFVRPHHRQDLFERRLAWIRHWLGV